MMFSTFIASSSPNLLEVSTRLLEQCADVLNLTLPGLLLAPPTQRCATLVRAGLPLARCSRSATDNAEGLRGDYHSRTFGF